MTRILFLTHCCNLGAQVNRRKKYSLYTIIFTPLPTRAPKTDNLVLENVIQKTISEAPTSYKSWNLSTPEQSAQGSSMREVG